MAKPKSTRKASPEEEDGSPKGTQTLDRGLAILEQVVLQPMQRSEIAACLGLSRSTSFRLVKRLVELGFLSEARDGRLQAGSKLMQLGAVAASQSDLIGTAAPHLNALASSTGCSAFLGKREGDFSVHLYRAAGTQRVLVATPVGTRRPLAETSLGKALLFDDDQASWERLLPQAATDFRPPTWMDDMKRHVQRGVVIHQGPPPESIRAIACPVRDASGKIAAAITLASVSQYLDLPQMRALAPKVLETARTISRELGWTEAAGQRPLR
jgi:DNA-binding IclR family transcriptional regulator